MVRWFWRCLTATVVIGVLIGVLILAEGMLLGNNAAWVEGVMFWLAIAGSVLLLIGLIPFAGTLICGTVLAIRFLVKKSV